MLLDSVMIFPGKKLKIDFNKPCKFTRNTLIHAASEILPIGEKQNFTLVFIRTRKICKTLSVLIFSYYWYVFRIITILLVKTFMKIVSNFLGPK